MKMEMSDSCNLCAKLRIDNYYMRIIDVKAAGLTNGPPKTTVTQTDTYWAIKNKDCSYLKLRETRGLGAELIWYKRNKLSSGLFSTLPKVVGIQNACKDVFNMKILLEMTLGKQLGVIRKERRTYIYRDTFIHLDTIEGVGTFVELESTMENKGTIRNLMTELSLCEPNCHLMEESYIDLI
jgi:predicted adenylyl cyclase CyaB